jgi:plastocyanin
MPFPRTVSAYFSPLLAGLLCFVAAAVQAEDGEPVEIKAVAGLRYDPPRFVVKPGAKVRLQVENTDDMAHNFVVVAPGGRTRRC